MVITKTRTASPYIIYINKTDSGLQGNKGIKSPSIAWHEINKRKNTNIQFYPLSILSMTQSAPFF